MIKDNIKYIEDKIAKSCLNANRNFDEIKLVAVSKQNTIEKIKEAQNFGILDFGENKAQELKQKVTEINDNIRWHFIGHLQRNKVRDIIPYTFLIHSVDTEKLLLEINKRAANIQKVQKILLEVNISGEESKYGLKTFDDVHKILNTSDGLNNVLPIGLMTMAPFTNDEEIIRKTFRGLREMLERVNEKGYKLKELSMGMTNDFETAIEEGATILRIGTAIFKE
ncbi:MAG: YggS family pyridoxal phosphate-dependent enzyme [Ignavibacteriae bacterium]|nr:MAG: YggS family pyridoxal phosphate-dependent enzyme [Ignavibacteriota bacterium]